MEKLYSQIPFLMLGFFEKHILLDTVDSCNAENSKITEALDVAILTASFELESGFLKKLPEKNEIDVRNTLFQPTSVCGQKDEF